MKFIVLILGLLLFSVACDRIHRVQTYQVRATKACLQHGHSPEECKPLPYPSNPPK